MAQVFGGMPTPSAPSTSGPYINPGASAGGPYRTTPAVTYPNGRPPMPQQTVMGGGAQNQVRAVGPTSGFDPSYLQNLATSDAGAFARPQGGLNFNPLGNLTGIPGQGVSGGGNAPVPGIPQGMLTQALAANPTFQQPGAAGQTPQQQQQLAQMLQSIFGNSALLGTNPAATGGFTL